ncbi:MAG: phosphate acyltransferase PlsX [Thermoleophilia bacterium]
MNQNTDKDSRSTVIALDAMGGDFAPREIVMGAVAVASPALRITLIGRTAEIESHLADVPAKVRDFISIVEAPDVIGFDEEPAKAVKSKDNSSLVAACREVVEGRADGMVSAGSTGAIMAAALIKLRRIKGLKRPGLCAILPTPGRPTIFIDVGANSAVRPVHLLEFAIMGGMFAEQVLDLKNPSVGLLSIGEESIKGDEVVLEAHRLLIATPGLNFHGNVEGRDIVRKVVDVVVTDGFTGNVCLKLMESTSSLIMEEIRRVASSSLSAKLGGLLLKGKLREFKKTIDTEEFGGAYLLGVRGLVVICHGNSSRKAIASALKYAGRAAEQQLITKLERRIAEIQ